METTNESIVELFHKIMKTNKYQGKQIAKLILWIETLTKILDLDRTRAPLQEEDKKQKTAAKKGAICASNSKKKDCLMKLEKNSKIGQLVWFKIILDWVIEGSKKKGIDEKD